MLRILIGHFLVYIFLFLIIELKIVEVIPISLISLIIIVYYIYIGYIAAQYQTKVLSYFILSFIGFFFFIVALIISPNHLLTKTINSSYVWLTVDLYLAPFETMRYLLRIKYLNRPALPTYLIEIVLLGILPYLGRILKIKLTEKTATNSG